MSTLFMDLVCCKFLCQGSTLGSLYFLQFAPWKIYVKRFGGRYCDYRDTGETLQRHFRGTLETLEIA